MRTRELVGEAGRNVWAGVGIPLVWALATAFLVGGVVVLDVRLLVETNQKVVQWRDSGASIVVAHAPAGIDGNVCERLSHTPGITASGAGRMVTNGLALPALPGGSPSYAEVTPGFARLIATTASGSQTDRVANPQVLAAGGLLLSESLADVLERDAGSTLATGLGQARIAGAYAVPSDGRQSPLGFAALAQVPAVGLFDFCWAEVWPPSPLTASLVRSAGDPRQSKLDIQVGQLNSTLGSDLDPADLYRSRPTRGAPAIAGILGLILGLASVRLRRLELASALHAGVSKPALGLQIGIETAIWTFVGLVLAFPAIWYAAHANNPLPAEYVAGPALAGVVSGAIATLVGAYVGLAVTREQQLFDYFKNR